jgi:hypothetical protein
MKVIKLHKWIKARLEYGNQGVVEARLFEHYHRLRLYEAEILSRNVKCRECPNRH